MAQAVHPDMKFFEVQDDTEVYAALSKEEIIQQFKEHYGIELGEDEHLEEVDGDSGSVTIEPYAADEDDLDTLWTAKCKEMYGDRIEGNKLHLTYREVYLVHCATGTADQAPLIICSANY